MHKMSLPDSRQEDTGLYTTLELTSNLVEDARNVGAQQSNSADDDDRD